MNPREERRPPFYGFAVAATLWVWSLLLFYAVPYLSIRGGWRIPLAAIGWLFLLAALLGALVEVSNILKTRENKALSHFSTGFFFLVPAMILFLALRFYPSLFAYYQSLLSLRISILKTAVLVFTAIGSMFFLQGIPYLLWKPVTRKSQLPKKNSTEQKATRHRLFASTIIFVLTLATVMLQLLHALASWKT